MKTNIIFNYSFVFFIFAIFFVTKIYSDEGIARVADCQVAKMVDNSVNILVGKDFCELLIGNKIFARYVTNFNGTPIIYPIYADDKKMMTRDFPMETRNVKTKDHPHHRSFWFAHGKVNDTDFWQVDKKLKNIGKIVHKNFIKTEVSDRTRGIIVTENDWVDVRGGVICSDVRAFEFGITGLGNRYIDFEIVVTARVEKATFYDTKEGTFAIRVADWLSVDVGKGEEKNGVGEVSPVSYIVNADGKFDGDAWGKRSAWVDYVGQFVDGEGELAGIAVLNHPSSFRYPTYWHVRSYGLLAANPFGERGFGVKKRPAENAGGDYVLAKGESFTLRYRIIFHNGNTKEAAIENEFKEYSNKKISNILVELL
ncbi:MAG: PmoA family protein [Planctomycetaceae bacterium]|jgi:hypothetical protein|nr:PmoA family protein [Planctomycetaceae bacterium]